MFNLSDAPVEITKELILNRVTEEAIFRHYCTNFKYIGRPFTSEFYNDTKPGCFIFYSNGKLMYKDHGEDHYFDCFGYVSYKLGLSFHETLKKIAFDLNISPINDDVLKTLHNPIIVQKQPLKAIKSDLRIIKQPYTITDKEYWGKYGISLELLYEYKVHSVRQLRVYKDNELYTYDYRTYNPIYAYEFNYDNNTYYKIYKPLQKEYRWLFSGNSRCIEGFANLPESGNLLILTKSLKDVMVYKILGYPAISLTSETGKIARDTVNKLKLRFKTILVNQDNDKHGIRATISLQQQYGFNAFYIPELKDISDYIANKGYKQTKLMLNEQIKDWL